MEQRDGNSLLKVIVEGIAYFVSGVFVINYVAPVLLSQDQGNLVSRLGSWLTIVVGGFSVVVGFLFVSTVIPCKHRPRLLRYFDERKDWMLFILFPITLPQIFANIDSLAIFVLAVVFLFFILTTMVARYWQIITKRPRTYTRNLVALSLAFGVSAIIRLFQEASRTEIAMFLVVICSLLVLALGWKKERQLRLFKR